MSKNLQKILAGSLATLSSLSVVTPVMGATVDVDTLYKNAYEAMRTAEETETQADINTAMELIWQLRHIGDEKKDENLVNAACTWSSLVDQVQHPKLVKIVDAILEAQKTGKQADINAAFETIEEELPAVWRSSYTSAIDLVQQDLQKKLIQAVEKAELTKTEAAKQEARDLITELTTADNPAIVEWANKFAVRINSITSGSSDVEVGDKEEEVTGLQVTKVDSITSTHVTVTFKALSNSLDDVIVNVVDNNGKTVTVKSISTIAKGTTTAEFEFANSYSNKLEGTWTVNGVSHSFIDGNFVKDIQNAINDFYNGSNDVKKHEAKLKFKKILDENSITYKEDNIEDYLDGLNKVRNINNNFSYSIKEVQDEINAIDYVKATFAVLQNDSTDAQVMSVLNDGVKKGYIENINPNWVTHYKKEASNVITNNVLNNIPLYSLKTLQEAVINTGNAIGVQKVYSGLIDTNTNVDKNTTLDLIKKLNLDNVKDENKQAYYADKSEIEKVITGATSGTAQDKLKAAKKVIDTINKKVDVVNATTPSAMLEALTAFAADQNITNFNGLLSANKEDVAEELLKTSNQTNLKDTNATSNKVKTLIEDTCKVATDNVKQVNKALDEYKKGLPPVTRTTGTELLVAALKTIVGRDVTPTEATKFYEDSLETDRHGNTTIKTYNNYTEIRDVFNK